MPDEPPRPGADGPGRVPDLEPVDDVACDESLAVLLRDPSVWTDARQSLEGAVVDAVRAHVDAEARAYRRRPRRRRYVLVAATAVALVLAVIVAAVLIVRESRVHNEFTVQLAGTDLARGARATAGIARNRGGFTVTLDARGLERLPADEFYEAWLKNDEGTLVPIGTFSSGDSRITLWSGVSPGDFETMTVTIEREDGNQSSSGRRVLTGPVRPR